MLADLSGAFAPLVTEIVEAQKVYWDKVNANGGIAGRQVELDHRGQRLRRRHAAGEVRGDRATRWRSSASRPARRTRPRSPRRWSTTTWSRSRCRGTRAGRFGESARTRFESYTNYCFESMNGIEWFAKNRDVQTVAIISFPGEYGGDGAAGAAMAAEAARARGRVRRHRPGHPAVGRQPEPRPDARSSPRSSQSNADLVWATINPTTLGGDHGRRRAAGLHGPVVGQLADLQLQAARHRAGAAARPVLHRLDLHRHVGHRRAGHGRRSSTR